MADMIHPLAAHHLPSFITAPGETDALLIAMAIFLVAIIIGVGVLYFRLHALPEQMAHGTNNKVQFEIVAVLALLALFTHNNLFWVAALLLAMVPIPDFTAPLHAMVAELRRIATGGRSASPAMTEGAQVAVEAAPQSPTTGV